MHCDQKVIIVHPEWNLGEIDLFSRTYNDVIYKKRKIYLINLSDTESKSLSLQDRYDRLNYTAYNYTAKSNYNVRKNKYSLSDYLKNSLKNENTYDD